MRYFPDKLPIGDAARAWIGHVFVYLVTRPSPMDFRLFLLRHVTLLRVHVPVDDPVAFPRKLVEGQARLPPRGSRASRRHHCTRRLSRRWSGCSPNDDGSPRAESDRRMSATRRWKRRSRLPDSRLSIASGWRNPANTLWMAQSPLIADALDRDEGCVECVQLSRQYLHLSPLVEVA